MVTPMRFYLTLFCITVSGLSLADDKRIDNEKLFVGKVLPTLQAKCVSCHGDDAEKIKGDFNLSTQKLALVGGESGRPSIVPGKPLQSPLYLSVLREHDDWSPMPPKENDKVLPGDVAAIRTWIADGAHWPDAERIKELQKQLDSEWSNSDGIKVKTSGGLSNDWTNRRYKPADLWAYQPLTKPKVPASNASNPIDAFINGKLTDRGLSPAPLADRRTLIRRATFDLIGLPPTPAEVDAFVNDPASDDLAFANVIDRLLASPHYGEQWGRHWLDVSRYADSSGFSNDFDRGNAWRYRDYVIRSFNNDKPYNDFVREQVAGDEIKPNDPEMKIAVGFLRMGPWELTGMEVAKVARQRFLDDVTDTVGQVFLAHAMQCCRCHDHKFDPLPTRDYYSLQATFATTQLAEAPAPFLEKENTSGFEEQKYLEESRKRAEQERDRIDASHTASLKAWREKHPGEKDPERVEYLSPYDLGMERYTRKTLARLEWELERYKPFALTVYDGRTPPMKNYMEPRRPAKKPFVEGALEQTHILTGGDVFSPSLEVEPGALSVIPVSVEIPETIVGRRKALADWLVDPGNPLTPRVMANRIWQWHFNQALAGNPNNFGATGKKPTHPELLDWLAATFVEEGWSIKRMHKRIMMSQAYRRASQHPHPEQVQKLDATGELYATFQPRRLTAEELRDAMLRVSGELNPMVGGIPARPNINPEVAYQPRMVMGTFSTAYQPSVLPLQRNRRSIYTLQLRGLRDPFFEVFNQPGSDTPCELRDAATVTPQAFTLLNGSETMTRALVLAQRLLKETQTPEAAIRRVFRLCMGRLPTETETAACLKHWDAMTERHQSVTMEKTTMPESIEREAVEENTGESFRFTEVLDVAKDYVADPHPADASPRERGLMEVCLVLLNTNEFAYID